MTSSVTGCSTCRRVFISRKKNSWASPSPATMNSTVPGTDVVDRPRGGHGGGVHPLQRRGRRPGRGGLLDHLLVAALDRALALEGVHDVAVGVAEDLHLDVPAALQVALEEDGRIAERRRRLVARGGHRLEQVVGLADQAHALAAAAGRGLDEQGQARPTAPAAVMSASLASASSSAPGTSGTPAAATSRLASTLSAMAFIDSGRRPDPGQAGIGHGLGEHRVLRQEAVTRVDRVGTGPPCRVQHLLGHQVGLRRRPPADGHREVGVPDEWRACVRVGVDRDGLQAHPVGGADHPPGDLAPVRDEDPPDRAELVACVW